MGKAARNRARAVASVRTQPTLHDALGTEPASSPALPPGPPPAPRPAVVAARAWLDRTAHLVDEDLGAEALRSLPAAQVALDALTRQAVELARAQGATWQQVGEVFGMSKQAAQQRWGR